MSIRKINFVEGEYYHLYNRGNSKQIIFHDNHDNEYFIHLLEALNTKSRVRVKTLNNKKEQEDKIVSIGAYCLMPNHFHILIAQEKENGISIFMQKISTAYVMYYNKKYKRTGGLFEGKFKSRHANEDVYLKYLFSYIHLNPLKIKRSNLILEEENGSNEKIYFLSNYQYSSFHEYYTNRFVIVNKKAFPDYFPTRESFLKEIFLWIKENPQKI